MVSSQSGVSEAPKPGCSGTITSCRAARSAMYGSQPPAPPAPCRIRSGRPAPPRIRVMLQPRTASFVGVGLVIAPLVCTFRDHTRYLSWSATLAIARLGAILVALLAAGRSADADRADHLVADLDRHAAAERDHLRQAALAHEIGFAALGPFQRRPPEGSGRVGLAAGELGAVRWRAVAPQQHLDLAGAVDHRHRQSTLRGAFHGGAGDRARELDRYVALGDHALRAGGGREGNRGERARQHSRRSTP